MNRKIATVAFSLAFASMLLSACGEGTGAAAYKDGTYIGKSSEDDRGAYGEATITIQNNQITDCQFVTWQKDGSKKDEDYGKVNGAISNPDYYEMAQLAVKAMEEYAQKLVEVQNLEGVDVISGATISHDQFQEAVRNALEEAQK